MDVEKLTKTISKTAKAKSIGYCARNVRQAIEASDGRITKPPMHAKDYGPSLEENGYTALTGLTIGEYTATNGDIIVWQNNNASKSGHIQVYVAEDDAWYSDFKQYSIFPNFKFSNIWINGGYTIYRHESNI